MEKLLENTFCSNPHRIALFSFPFYFILSNVILNLWRIVFYQSAHLELVGVYCNASDLPNGNQKYLAFLVLTFISKYALIAGVLWKLSKNKSQINLIGALVFVDLALIDGAGLFFYLFENYFSGFEYFLAGNQIYRLGRELYLPLWLFPLVNFMAGNSLLVYILKKYGRFSIKEMAAHYGWLSLSVLSAVLILNLMLYCYYF